MEKIKHKHTLTDILKVSIFAILMIAPLLASVSQMLYATFNKNAKDSYYGETINEVKTIDSNYTNLKNNKEYTLTITNLNDNQIALSRTTLYFQFKLLEKPENTYPSLIIGNNYIVGIYRPVDYTYTTYGFSNTVGGDVIYNLNSLNNSLIQFKIDILNKFTNIQNIDDVFLNTNTFTYEEYNKYSYLDNAFYYGVDQMTNSNLFAWSRNTTVYTGIKAMTDNLNVQTLTIPTLLSYWTILIIIYIIIDIILKVFTELTHMLSYKSKEK